MRRHLVAGGGLLAVAGLAALLSMRSIHRPASPEELAALRDRRDRLAADVEKAFATRHPVGAIEARAASVTLVIHSGFVVDLATRVVPEYLARVELDLQGITADEDGAIHKDTFLGDIKLGDWAIHLVLIEARGVLTAGPPRLTFGEGGIGVIQPFELVQGHVRGALDFRWDSSGLTNVVCRDFETSIEVEGDARPRDYEAAGLLRVSAEQGLITLNPDFGRPRFRLEAVADAATWERALSALEDQDGLFECGLAMDPPDVIDRLRDVVAAGFDIGLPAHLFRQVSWPAHLTEAIDVQGRRVSIEVRSPQVDVTDSMLIYAADVDVTTSEADLSAGS